LFEFFNVVFFATTQGQEDEGEGVELFGVQKVFMLTGFETAVPKQREILACHWRKSGLHLLDYGDHTPTTNHIFVFGKDL
jgi:hypothetical protein